MSWLKYRSELKAALDGIVERLTDGGADKHLHSSDGGAVLRVPVISVVRCDLDDGDAGIVLAFGEPSFNDWLPELLDPGFVARNAGVAMQDKKVGMNGSLKIKGNGRVASELFVLVAVVGAQEPKVTGVVDLLNRHGSRAGRAGCLRSCAKETCLGFVDQFLHLFDRFRAGQVFSILFGLILID